MISYVHSKQSFPHTQHTICAAQHTHEILFWDVNNLYYICTKSKQNKSIYGKVQGNDDCGQRFRKAHFGTVCSV